MHDIAAVKNMSHILIEVIPILFKHIHVQTKLVRLQKNAVISYFNLQFNVTHGSQLYSLSSSNTLAYL